jgi:hypothetical protein
VLKPFLIVKFHYALAAAGQCPRLDPAHPHVSLPVSLIVSQIGTTRPRACGVIPSWPGIEEQRSRKPAGARVKRRLRGASCKMSAIGSPCYRVRLSLLCRTAVNVHILTPCRTARNRRHATGARERDGTVVVIYRQLVISQRLTGREHSRRPPTEG